MPCVDEEARAPGRHRAPPPAATRGWPRTPETPRTMPHARHTDAPRAAANTSEVRAPQFRLTFTHLQTAQ